MKITYESEEKTRLDKYLTEQYPNTSRSQIQKTIKNGGVLINGKKTTVHHFLKCGDEIEMKVNFEEKKEEKNVEVKPNKNVKLDIISETDDYLVINKPAGMLVHPTDKNEDDTLANGLLAYFPDIKNVGEDVLRAGIVHRIDRDVSGALVVAKTQKMFEHLKSQFQNREIKKIYLALVYGKLSDSSGKIDFPIGINKHIGKMAARSKTTDIESKSAVTFYEVLKQFQHYGFLKIEIKTGRTHQIRVHLNALGYPVVGDEIYRPKNLKTRVNLDRIFLHAHILGFNDLDGEWKEFTCEMPEELKGFLEKLS
ncbi:MAG: RluA family pseudouridine synthase [bacterium]